MDRRTKKHGLKKENTRVAVLQTLRKSQRLNKVEMTKTKQNNKDAQKTPAFLLNQRFIKVIGISLDPSTVSGQNRLFIVKDCILP